MQFTELCHYLPEVLSQTKANTYMANPMQNKWVCSQKLAGTLLQSLRGYQP